MKDQLIQEPQGNDSWQGCESREEAVSEVLLITFRRERIPRSLCWAGLGRAGGTDTFTTLITA